MNKSAERGRRGEQVACNYLRNLNYLVCARNFCVGKNEIDIIAKKGDILVFIEVKSRSSNLFGFPETAVSLRQQRSIFSAAEAYMDIYAWSGAIRFDIISIEWRPKGHKLSHFEDAFY